jgi:N-acetyl-anhydromuramyl-L-alanine amidase AmpD
MNHSGGIMPLRSVLLLLLFLLPFTLLSGLDIKVYPISNAVTPRKLELLGEYCLRHYGSSSVELKDPKMIVIHFTEIGSLKKSVEYFLPDTVEAGRNDIKGFGKVNIGIHFFVDKDGSVLSFFPENLIARHAIGYNHTSFGIENIALDKKHLTKAQLEADTELVEYLVKRHPSVEYLIGHDEYALTNRPHFVLYKAMDTNYRMIPKPDPGKPFMKDLRANLKKKYSLTLKD